jgi:uncharacterized tellurite resistance protein B-like protein
MLRALSELIERSLGQTRAQAPEERAHAVRLATAILLVEVVRADYQVSTQESGALLKLLRGFFALSDEETTLLVQQAEAEADHAASLQSYTRQIHEGLSHEDKFAIVELLWRAALADEHLDKHEDHLVRKIAGLLYVSHGDLIRLRNRVKDPDSTKL